MNQDQFHCQGYGQDMSPQRCLENQLSLYCLDGFPCHDCPEKRGAGDGGLPKTADRKPEPHQKWPEHLKNATAAVRRAWLGK